ncbi:hypothetical protein GCM10010495_24170 [Kitasatospora herbaricolor]|uniref:DUF5682 family protein n=1 Tax=Kitasatospora herbaricolor TaxID=68217 RepID=UPI0019B1AC4B|nr:DUF5682 family protein [Kitasatospora herbaricolor]MDQ0308800.1 hypothetical protein [Kitasatospora herbaricolor]GGV10140.1 hypothetical protein GCM10010495_24170 [Kitasatospora herbaricolor]
MSAEVTLLGVRHHGPGSARAVAAALEQLRPDVVLVEGPPEADPIIGLAAEKEMVPPVALLAHAVDDPARAAFWPFAVFSPEWVAVRYALDADVPVRFVDLPAAYGLAAEPTGHRGPSEPSGGVPGGTSPDGRPGPALPDGDGPGDGGGPRDGGPDGHLPDGGLLDGGLPDGGPANGDPIGALAAAAGHDDAERWWEDVVEHRAPGADALAPFTAVAEAMTALREDGGAGRRDELREAYMRQQIRAARRAGHRRIAVVCGAWHVPALATMPTVAHDRALLATLPKKVRTEITWVPWTHRRLSQHTGYGAGIASPGWYHHLFSTDGDPLARWMTRAADLLRQEDHPVSSAHVIEAVRLAGTLAVMRGRPLAGLTETLDAVRSVMCDGSDVALALVHDRLVIGDALGEVPDAAPAVPLQRDLTRLQRTLRLKPEPEARELDLDLRKENDVARSRLLHRLRLLGVDWGTPSRSAVNSTGTFRESWRLRWEPEFAVRIVEAAQWGTTVEDAATGRAVETAARAGELGALTGLVERCLLAGLSRALPAVMRVLADRAALDTDVAQLASALPALVRALRYGDVRGTDSTALDAVARGLAERICVGLPPGCTGLDAEGAAAMRRSVDAVHAAIGLLENATENAAGAAVGDGAGDGAAPPAADSLADRWAATLASLARREPAGGAATGVPGLLRGRAVRLLLDDGRLDSAEAGRRMGLVLSTASAPADAAGWVEGFLAGGGALLLHDARLLGLLDGWLAGVPGEVFTDVLPLLRRTFSALEAGVRRTVGEQVAAGPLGAPSARPAGPAADLDEERADAALPTVALLLGLAGPPPDGPGRPDDGLRRIPRQADRRSA